jgi:Predicted integral membrane protein
MNPRVWRERRRQVARKKNPVDGSERNGQNRLNINVGEFERQASMWGGTAMAMYGLLKGRLSGLLLAAIGGALIYRGHTGHCHMYEALDYNTADVAGTGQGDHAERHAARQQRHTEAAK